MGLRVRAARPQDRNAWCELAGRAGPDVEAAWWDAHNADPAWRLLVAENGAVVGKTAARLLPGLGVQVAPPRIRTGSPVAPVATALLESALLLRQEGPYPAFEFKVADSLPHYADLCKAAEGLHFSVHRESVHVERPLTNLERSPPMAFACRTHAELGDTFFLPVVQKAGDLAPADWSRILQHPGVDPAWTFLANKTGEALGFVVTAVLPHDPKVGSVPMLGILPEKRKKGHGALLHRFALDALRRRGATTYRDAVDKRDAAARRLLAKNGCRETGTDRIYRWTPKRN